MSDIRQPDRERQQALFRSADAARYAPSVHNTQPWRWVVSADRLDLYAAGERQLQALDPEGRLLLLSCGAALHHARLALDADGWQHHVDRAADTPLATIRATGRVPISPAAARHAQTLQRRHTDRRAVSGDPVSDKVLQALVGAAEREGARLHLLNRDQVIELAVLMEHAQDTQVANPQLHAETATWVGGDRPGGAGVPDTALPHELPLTTVAERDFGVAGTLDAGEGHDTAASYALLYGPGDEAADWLCAGEALSALWITASEHGVGVLPLSSPVEVPFVREQARRLIGNLGVVYLAIRVGTLQPDHAGPPQAPRLPADQVSAVQS